MTHQEVLANGLRELSRLHHEMKLLVSRMEASCDFILRDDVSARRQVCENKIRQDMGDLALRIERGIKEGISPEVANWLASELRRMAAQGGEG
jgi:hypothetical protein